MRVADTASVASRIELAFQSASTSTGTSFDYLVKTAARESAFDPTAKARTSSATGLFQFIESTWLETLKEAGPKHGLEKYADQISRGKNGKHYVSDPQMRKEILDLRKDPEISSVMAGALTQKNAAHLQRKIGREPTDGELYMAHFLGAHGASKLIDATAANPDMRADKMFSRQARANKPIFYHSNGKARSMEEVYQAIVSKHDEVSKIAVASGKRGPGLSSELTAVAAVPSAKPMNAAPLIDHDSFDHLAGDPAARFAMRSKPTPPSQVAEAPAADNRFDMAFSAVENAPTQQRFDSAFAAIADARSGQVPEEPQPAAANVASADVPQLPQSAPADPQTPPATASVFEGPDGAADNVVAAFQAGDTGNPFEALFRNDEGSESAGVNPRFASAFAAVEQAGIYGTLDSSSARVAAQELALGNQGNPLDLTRFLRLRTDDEQKDLLPPV